MKKRYLVPGLPVSLLLVIMLAACGNSSSTPGSAASTDTTTSGAGNSLVTTSATGGGSMMTTSAAGGSMMTTGAAGGSMMTTNAAGGSMMTPGATGSANLTAVDTAAASQTAYPNGTVLSLSNLLEKQFAQTLAPNISNPGLLTIVTKDDPNTVVTYFNKKFTGLGYSPVNAATGSTTLPLGLKGQSATFSCKAASAPGATPVSSISTSGCTAAAGSASGTTSNAATATASGIQVIALGPLDATGISLLTSQAPDLSKVLTPNSTVIMVFSGTLNGTQS